MAQGRDRLWAVFNLFLISNFRRVLNVVCFLLGDSPASEVYMPTFRTTLSVTSSQAGMYLPPYEDGTDRVYLPCLLHSYRHIRSCCINTHHKINRATQPPQK
jgi:hypothetical protein